MAWSFPGHGLNHCCDGCEWQWRSFHSDSVGRLQDKISAARTSQMLADFGPKWFAPESFDEGKSDLMESLSLGFAR